MRSAMAAEPTGSSNQTELRAEARVTRGHVSAGVHAYLEAVRAHYLEALRRGARDATSSGGKVIFEAEVNIELPDGSKADMPGELALPYRYDIVCLVSGGAKPIMIVADHSIAWEPAAFDFGGPFIARVAHLVWSVCVIGARPAPPRAQWELLRGWFMKWFRADSAEDTPFSGVVHFMSDPELSERGDMIRVQVDLGSAPTTALIELLGVFGQMGCLEGLVYTPAEALAAP